MGSCPGPGSLPSSICHVGQRKLWPWHFRPQAPRFRHPQNEESIPRSPRSPRGSPGTARSCSPGGNSMEDEVGAGVWGAPKSRSCSRLRHSRRCLHLRLGAPSSSPRTARGSARPYGCSRILEGKEGFYGLGWIWILPGGGGSVWVRPLSQWHIPALLCFGFLKDSYGAGSLGTGRQDSGWDILKLESPHASVLGKQTCCVQDFLLSRVPAPRQDYGIS